MGTGLPAGRGVLDTSTVILLGELTDATALPAEPLITAVTLASFPLARSSPAMSGSVPRARRTFSRPRRTLTRFLSMPAPPGPSGASRHRCAAPVARAQGGATTR